MSYYRTSEIAGAMFFARLAKSIRNPAIQHDLTKHFADEIATRLVLVRMTLPIWAPNPMRVADAYQSQYSTPSARRSTSWRCWPLRKYSKSAPINHYFAAQQAR